MIDVYAPAGTFRDRAKLVRDLATAAMTIERVPNIPLFARNTAAFVHELPPDSLSNVDGESACVRVQVLANAGGLDREKQVNVVAELTRIVAAAAIEPRLAERTWCCSPSRRTVDGVSVAGRTPMQNSSLWRASNSANVDERMRRMSNALSSGRSPSRVT